MSGKYRKNRGTGKKIGILIVVLISLFCIIFFSARGRFQAPVLNQAVSVIVTPFQSAISWVGSQLNYVTSNIWEIVTVHQQNKMLRNEVDSCASRIFTPVNTMRRTSACGLCSATSSRRRSLTSWLPESSVVNRQPGRVSSRSTAARATAWMSTWLS